MRQYCYAKNTVCWPAFQVCKSLLDPVAIILDIVILPDDSPPTVNTELVGDVLFQVDDIVAASSVRNCVSG